MEKKLDKIKNLPYQKILYGLKWFYWNNQFALEIQLSKRISLPALRLRMIKHCTLEKKINLLLSDITKTFGKTSSNDAEIFWLSPIQCCFNSAWTDYKPDGDLLDQS